MNTFLKQLTTNLNSTILLIVLIFICLFVTLYIVYTILRRNYIEFSIYLDILFLTVIPSLILYVILSHILFSTSIIMFLIALVDIVMTYIYLDSRDILDKDVVIDVLVLQYTIIILAALTYFVINNIIALLFIIPPLIFAGLVLLNLFYFKKEKIVLAEISTLLGVELFMEKIIYRENEYIYILSLFGVICGIILGVYVLFFLNNKDYSKYLDILRKKGEKNEKSDGIVQTK